MFAKGGSVYDLIAEANVSIMVTGIRLNMPKNVFICLQHAFLPLGGSKSDTLGL